MGIDVVFDRDGQTIFEGETAVVEKWLINNKIPRNYRVLVQGFQKQISVNTYLLLDQPKPEKPANEIRIYNSLGEEIFRGEPNKFIKKWTYKPNAPYTSFKGVTIVDKADENKHEFVDKWYMMNPKTEAVLPFSSHLENGMEVLIESPELKLDVSQSLLDGEDAYRALVTNRWCIVSKLKIHSDGEVTFVGVYEDGLHLTRSYGSRDSWIVKKSSLPQEPVTDDDWHEVAKNTGGEYDEEKGEITHRSEPQMRTDDTPSWVSETERRWQHEKGTSTAI